MPTAHVEAAKKYEWATALYGLSKEQIKQAIDICKLNLAWPPSIAEFRQIALNVRIEQAPQATDGAPNLKKLANRPRANPTIVKACLAEMRTKLAVVNKHRR
jgi:hypothetical protein